MHQGDENAPLDDVFLEQGRVPGIPYGALVARGFDNLMMAGRDISVDPVTFGATRIMNVCMAAGQAAGEAAAMVVSEGKLPKEVDVQELRKHLLEQKAILDV